MPKSEIDLKTSAKHNITDIQIVQWNDLRNSTKKEATEENWVATETDNDDAQDENFDGGWGWFIVISSMLVHFIVAGLNRAAGILYLRFEEKFNKPAAITAWVTSLSVSLTLAVGPIASALCNKYSYRIVVIVGGVILAVSMVASGLSPNLYFLFLSYGVFGGIGKAFAYGPGVVIVGLYFTQKRGTAVGLATSGVALGAFAVPSIVELAFVHYGYFGAFIIMTGIALQMIVCGFLFRPIAFHRKKTRFDRRKRLLAEAWKNECNNNITNVKSLDTVENGDIFTITNTQNKKSITKQVNGSLRGTRPNAEKKEIRPVMQRGYSLDREKDVKEEEERKKMKMFNFSLLRNMRFNGFCMAVLLFNFSFQSSMIFLPTFSNKVGLKSFEAFPVVVTGIFDGLGRIISGLLFDRNCIKPYRAYVYNAALCSLGITSFIFPSIVDAYQLGLVCAIYGLFLGTGISQQSVIIVDILGAENLSYGFGILLLYQGIGTFVGPPLSGLFKDINGTYDYAFYIGGIVAIIGAVILMIANRASQKQKAHAYEVKSSVVKYSIDTHF